jgi:hypothetical protein
MYASGTDTYIGKHGNGQPGFEFQGMMDDVRIYDRAMSPAEIAELASAGGSASDTDTVAITVTAVNDDPTATNNANTVTEDTALTANGNMLTDDDGSGVDSDVDTGDTLTVSEIDGEIDPAVDVTGSYGTLNWDTDGSYTSPFKVTSY